MVIAGKHAYVLSSTTWMSVYNTQDLKLVTRYNITERSAEHFPFRFNDNALFVTEDSVIVCSPEGKRSVSKPKRQTGIPLQIGSSYFIVMSLTEIALYEFSNITSTVSIRQVVTHAILSSRFPGARDLQ